MSENELTVKKEKTLGQRLGFTSQHDFIAGKIFVSKYGTVDLSQLSGIKSVLGIDEETTFANFIKKVNNRINSGTDTIKYDKKTNSFYLVSKVSVKRTDYIKNIEIKEAFKIAIDEKTMKDYASGKYDKYTSILHNLCIESEEKEKLMAKEKARENERNAIIAKVENGHNELTPLEARIYLDHLEKLDSRNTKEIAKKGAQLTAVAGFPLAGGLLAGAICFAPGPAFVITVLAALVGTATASMVEGIIKLFASDSTSLEMFPINSSKQLIRDIKKNINELKVNKTKEKELKRIKYVDKMVMPKSVTIEVSDPIEALDLKDHIMNEIDATIDKVAYINSEDRASLLDELKNLLNTYIERKTAIIGQDNRTSRAEADSLANLRNDICKELAKIDIKISSIKAKEAKTKALTSEAKLLTDKIDKVENLNPEELAKKQKEIDEMFAEEELEEEITKYSAK